MHCLRLRYLLCYEPQIIMKDFRLKSIFFFIKYRFNKNWDSKYMYVKFNNTRKQFYIAFCRYWIIHMWCDERILTLIEISSWSWNQDAALFDDGVYAMREREPERQVFGSPILLFRYNVRGYTHLNRPSYVGHHYSCLNVHISGLLHTKVRILFI